MRTVAPTLECMALVTALVHPNRQARNYILSNLTEDDFATEPGSEIRQRMGVLFRSHGEVGNLVEMREDVALSDEAREFLTVPAPKIRAAKRKKKGEVRTLVRKLQDWRRRRTYLQGVEDLAELGTGKYESDTLEKAKFRLEQLLRDIQTDQRKTVTHIGRGRKREDIKQWVHGMTEEDPRGFVKTGLVHLDNHIGGFQRGDLVVLSAPRGGGKTAMLLQMALNQFDMGMNVAIASLEMREEQLFERAFAAVTNTPFSKTRSRQMDRNERINLCKEWIKFEMGTSDDGDDTNLRKNRFSPFDIKDYNYTPDNVDLEIGPGNYDIIFVDYLSLFGLGQHKDLIRAQQEYSRQLKGIASRRDCVVVVLTQLSKEEHVKYGQAAEENADFWLWWRYGEDEAESGETQIRLGKARNSQRGMIPIKFRLSHMQVQTTGAATQSMSSYTDNQADRGKKGAKARKKAPPTPRTVDYDEQEDVFRGLDDSVNLEGSEPEEAPAPPKKKKKAPPKRKKKPPKREVSLNEEAGAEFDEL